MQTCCNLSPIWSQLLWNQSLNRCDDGLFTSVSIVLPKTWKSASLNASGGQQRRAFHGGSAFTFMYKQSCTQLQYSTRCGNSRVYWSICSSHSQSREHQCSKRWDHKLFYGENVTTGKSVEEQWVLLLARLNHNCDLRWTCSWSGARYVCSKIKLELCGFSDSLRITDFILKACFIQVNCWAVSHQQPWEFTCI